jgi:transposase InsO family protein
MRFETSEKPDATSCPPQRGAAPVGYLQELPAVELAAILYLRVWCAGGVTKDPIARDFRLLLGTDDGERSLPIRTLSTDNGKKFMDRLFGLRKRAATGKHEFDTLCTELGIDHRLTPPQSPQTNGMVERFNGRIEDVLQSHHFRSGEDLNATMHRYVLLYNQQLPQSVLQSRTPLQAMKD